MSEILPYEREKALEYTETWAMSRNPRYFDFEILGGDCTNFVSQVLIAGSSIMNYTRDLGWYYISANNRSPSWTNANFLYNFLTTNRVLGPFAYEVNVDRIEVGDIVQLFFSDSFVFDHSLIITTISEPRDYSNIFISSHTKNRYNLPLSTINFVKARFLHIMGSYK